MLGETLKLVETQAATRGRGSGRAILKRAAAVATAAGTVCAWLSLRFVRGRRRADSEWRISVPPELEGLGSVSELRILPLVDAQVRDGLLAEHGVSYLVVADGLKILFDLGLSGGRNGRLAHNARALDVDPGSIDVLVISHAHPDHVGGPRAALRRSFALPFPELDARGMEALTPVPMRHRFARCVHVGSPHVIAPGVATTGTIPRMLFWLGRTPEQALLVNVHGRGMVVIVGCGHQGIGRLLARAEALAKAPLHAVVGGLHLPVHGLSPQDVIGGARWPWQRTTERDVAEAIDTLRARHPDLVAVSPHDSSQWTLDRFADAFGDGYRTIRVGEEIRIAAPTLEPSVTPAAAGGRG